MSSTSRTWRPAIGAAEIAGDLHDARRHGGVAVAAHAQEVAGQLAGDGPHQVGHEDEGAAQDADHGQRPGRQPGVDLGPQLGDPPGDGGRRDELPGRAPPTVPDCGPAVNPPKSSGTWPGRHVVPNT